MSKLNGVRVIEIPRFKAISSELDTPDKIFGEFKVDERLIKSVPPYDAPDLAWFEGEKACWIWVANDWVAEADAAPHALIDFAGGTYVVGVADELDPKDCGDVYGHIVQWIEVSESFELAERSVLFHRIGCGNVEKALGMAQQEIFVPVKLRRK